SAATKMRKVSVTQGWDACWRLAPAATAPGRATAHDATSATSAASPAAAAGPAASTASAPSAPSAPTARGKLHAELGGCGAFLLNPVNGRQAGVGFSPPGGRALLGCFFFLGRLTGRRPGG